MILSDKTIRRELELGNLVITPIETSQIQPASVDLRLDKDVTLTPHEFLLASTYETVTLGAELSGLLAPRSTWARQGLGVANGWIDPGFSGQITLELYNHTRHYMTIPAGESVCQLVLFLLDGPAERVYNGKYQHQRGATAAKS